MIWGSVIWLIIGSGLIISTLDKSTLLIDDDNGSLGYLWGPLSLLFSFLMSFVVKDNSDGLEHIGFNPVLNTITGMALLIAVVIVVRSWRHGNGK